MYYSQVSIVKVNPNQLSAEHLRLHMFQYLETSKYTYHEKSNVQFTPLWAGTDKL